MIRFLADENFNNDILRGIRRHYPDIDILRVQETEVYQADDPTVLEWAAKERRILLTHDVNTMTKYAYERVEAGLAMPGILIVKMLAPAGEIIEELAMIAGASDPAEWDAKVTYLPLQ